MDGLVQYKEYTDDVGLIGIGNERSIIIKVAPASELPNNYSVQYSYYVVLSLVRTLSVMPG